MGALLLVFVIAANGESQGMAVKFDTMSKCEVAKSEMTALMAAPGTGVVYFSIACSPLIKADSA